MAASFIQLAPDGTGKRTQTFENTVGGQVVQAQAVGLVDQFGVPLVGRQATASSLPVTLASDHANVPVEGAPQAGVSGTLTAASTGATGTTSSTSITVCPVPRAGNVTIAIKGTAYSGTFYFEATDDNGANWYPIAGQRADASAVDVYTGPISNVARMWNFSAPGYTHVRVRCGTYVSGTATVNFFPGSFLGFPVLGTRSAVDSGRQPVTLSANAVAGVTTEALLSLTPNLNFAVGTAATQYTVPAFETLRIDAIVLSWVSTTTTLNTNRLTLRALTSGTLAANSPALWSTRLGWASSAVATNQVQNLAISLEDGMDFPAGTVLGLSHLAAAANGSLDVSLIGFLY